MYVYKIENSQDCDEKEKTVTVTLRMLISYFLRKKDFSRYSQPYHCGMPYII